MLCGLLYSGISVYSSQLLLSMVLILPFIFSQFRFSDTKDKLLMLCGLLCSIIHGAAMPLMIIVFGQMSDLFVYESILENWLDANWDNISMFYPNATMDDLLENPEKIV